MRYLLVLAIPVLIVAAPADSVKVWQGTLTLPTYEEGLPDPNPSFDIFRPERFTYPYTLRENLTDKRVDRNWRALYLENEYLKCSVLPDLGGHIYTCTDKINGQPMFYANPSIKKARVGYRGAWAAFGVEFNFPVSHNWASLSPVDFATRQNPDGSASIFVGNTDRVYGMEWIAEIRLQPGSTLVEQRMTLRNPTDLRWRYYWWNNAGVEVWNDSHIWYPMYRSAAHGFADVDSWPVNGAGLDLSIVGNHTAGNVSRFVHASREPFMGVYHPKTNAGTVHYAEYADVPAKKIWAWGVNPEGLSWRKALSDNESAYVEVQAGLFRNQETYAFLPPHETLRFTEYWTPVREIGGITRANRDAVLHAIRRGQDLTIGINVTHEVKGARIRISGAEQTADLTPARTYSRTVPAPAGKYTVELLSADGHVLLSHKEDGFDWDANVPTGPQPRPSHTSALEIGTDEEVNGRYLQAWSTYETALRSTPGDYELTKAAGRVALNVKRFDDAVRLLRTAQQKVSNDPEVSYLLGVAALDLDDLATARQQLEAAQRQPQFRPAARFALARVEALEKKYTAALTRVQQALDENPSMMNAGVLRIALLRRLGRSEEARLQLKNWRENDPTDAAFRFEAVLAGAPDAALWQHLAADPERILNLASDYIGAGLYDDGLKLLDHDYPAVDPLQAEPGAAAPRDHVLIAYYRGYCREKLGQSGASDFDAARHLSTRYIFPSRASTFPVLRTALSKNPGDATAHYLLGDLYLSAGLADRAIAEWEPLRKLQPAIPVLHRNLGRTLLFVKADDAHALEVFEEGLRADPSNPDLYDGAIQTLALVGKPASERVRMLKQFPDPSTMPVGLSFEMALALGESGAFDEARASLQNRFFVLQEGGVTVQRVQQELKLMQAISQARSGDCAGAKSAVGSAPGVRGRYALAEVQAACKEPDAARTTLERVSRDRGPLAIAARAELHPETKAAALAELRDILRRPDRDLAHFYARTAMQDLQR